ncbi:hypothetical protein CAPTEDRAFT_226944 [Capitella teleta]|uniref:glucuronosyl-galactosyl-proteoglycan 4-alpha-N-acetylglucosaminyltransferase n=1 Tax=Capitella teleta TaxID=283909 RepID=R7TYP6_CAPTE|nr:hypothetical protein CAPTEDRAFT_226944 [Capitella teleta]|eukprot:ELT98834.1 hypothetical protein CAPTEDRAFT_226944 [Capitella teleta]
MRLSRLIGLLLVILITVPLVSHYYISKIGEEAINNVAAEGHHRTRTLDHVEEISTAKVSDLRARIEELRKIKASVNNELRDLESKRQKLHAEISGYNTHIESLKSSYEATNLEFQKLKVTIENTRIEQEELIKRNTPEVLAPQRILPPIRHEGHTDPPGSPSRCLMHNCFDFSRCSLSSQFPVFLYNPEEYNFADVPLDSFIKSSVTQALNASPYLTYEPSIACVYLVLIGDVLGGLRNTSSLEQRLKQLSHWNGDGHNHVLLNLARHGGNRDVFSSVNTGRALLVQSTFTEQQFRRGFDVIAPPSVGEAQGDVWLDLPPIVPARRKHLLSFHGRLNAPPLSNLSALHSNLLSSETEQLLSLEKTIAETLKRMEVKFPADNFLFDVTCANSKAEECLNGEWALCGTAESRTTILQQSTFSLIIAPLNYSVISTVQTQLRIYEAFKHGAIPVILGKYTELPFANEGLLQTDKALLRLPKQRVPELHFVIRSIPDVDVLEMRRQGRILWETFFGSTRKIMDSVLAILRHRLNLPSFPVRDVPTPSVFNDSFIPLTEVVTDPEPDGEVDILGPMETPMASLRFRHNFSLTVDPHPIPGDPFHLYPYTPFEPVMPGEAKFRGSGLGFRPIGKGAGGAGKEFSEALGGNHPREQFTIVILTFERESVLISALARLKGLPHLNKILVVWNNHLPPPMISFGQILGSKFTQQVVKTNKNSLNNRFLPYDAIETEAILSIDDDAHLRHDEIMFGFRVWRENRERVVGFPGRFHAWDVNGESWNYNSNYSCELSMVLTGAAFFHKYYAYMYSYVMPQAIRDKVDEYLNCEDLAMNFLVSHITRKPPIKVTSRWTFRCPGCPQALSVDHSHFQERHKCLNFFVEVYGYMPLLNTQFRVDSVLFKTRIPHDKQKCFKFI